MQAGTFLLCDHNHEIYNYLIENKITNKKLEVFKIINPNCELK